MPSFSTSNLWNSSVPARRTETWAPGRGRPRIVTRMWSSAVPSGAEEGRGGAAAGAVLAAGAAAGAAAAGGVREAVGVPDGEGPLRSRKRATPSARASRGRAASARFIGPITKRPRGRCGAPGARVLTLVRRDRVVQEDDVPVEALEAAAPVADRHVRPPHGADFERVVRDEQGVRRRRLAEVHARQADAVVEQDVSREAFVGVEGDHPELAQA